MTFAAVLVAAAAALVARPSRARLRLRLGRPARARLTHRSSPTQVRLVGAASALVGLATFGPSVALTVGVVVVVSLLVRRVARARRQRVEVDVALSIDLLGAAVACGSLPALALAAVAPGGGGPVGQVFAEAATALSLGVDPALVWARVGTAVPALGPAARACARAASSGAGVADELFRLAAAARADAQVRRRRRLERAGVWLVLPLGLCFLPAFVLVAVVPVVLSAAPSLAR